MEQLGRYILDRKLAAGGMAEVYLARQTGPGGAERVCVVKRMLEHLSEDTAFVEMFLDEARLAARLAHPGIAQIFDFGREGDTFYLALEYIEGSSLNVVLDIHRQRGLELPVPAAVRITSLVAQALDYAHSAADEKGRPMRIIHRDVSPHNVMISIGGAVKLIDFGIAKAANASHRTAIGTLKGKFAYMSPEQLHQQTLDHRSDIYSLGLVLYELLTGLAAVRGDNHAAVMSAAARRSYTPIDKLRPDTPRDVKAVLEKALALAPADRFATAREMAEALEACLTRTQTRVSPHELADLLHLELMSATTNPHILIHTPTLGSQAVPTRIERMEISLDEDVPPTVSARRRGDVETLPPDARTFDNLAKPTESQDLTPLEGSDAVIRKIDLSLAPTDPIKAAPDIEAAIARPPKSGPVMLPAVVVAPDSIAGQQKTKIASGPPVTAFVPAPDGATPIAGKPKVAADATPSVGKPKAASRPMPMLTQLTGKPPRRPGAQWPWRVFGALLFFTLGLAGAPLAWVKVTPMSLGVKVAIMQTVSPLWALEQVKKKLKRPSENLKGL